jgi:transcriptional regulator with XRE-family HTH domain
MSASDRFGPTLRRVREQRGITLEQVADLTNVEVGLWEAMERNDFSRWPSGIFARAFVREYARVIGVDTETTVDEFCRNFPNGDRRRGHIIQAEAELLGLPSEFHDDLVTPDEERRRAPRPPEPSQAARDALLIRRSRIAAAAFDVVIAAAGGALIGRAVDAPVLPVIGAVALAYHTAGSVFLGSTAGSALVSVWLRRAASADLRRIPPLAFPRLRRHLRATARP